ncbi:aspergillopepsin-2 precursor, putative [Paecilomyces variotii No. 5]|uniref:Aspergillopepsin-2, putative n=1 Tax=Byssochlamys spectabilis (strain No. 5 / NBRC 109023) TaxID=1356009 RepID=V5FV67_BYSSN|nr:aspergillopepsin-2 precursor, putative [Paecilomyces variotii No. 5]
MRDSRSFNIPAYQRFHSNAGMHVEPSLLEPSTADNNTLSFQNWSGAILESSNVTSVTGTFTIPNPKMPSGGTSSTAYCGCAWVGIDGDLDICPNGGLIQSGAAWCIQNDSPSFYAWYEWWPAQYMITFDNFDVEAGDELKVTVTATSTSTGNTIVENLTRGTIIGHTWDTESPVLCEATAEWIVEDFTDTSNGSEYLAPFANYGSVTFTDNSAIANGQIFGVSNAQIVNMVQNGSTISEASIFNNQLVTTYVG